MLPQAVPLCGDIKIEFFHSTKITGKKVNYNVIFCACTMYIVYSGTSIIVDTHPVTVNHLTVLIVVVLYRNTTIGTKANVNVRDVSSVHSERLHCIS